MARPTLSLDELGVTYP